MYNVYVKDFVIIEIVHMNEKTGTGVSSDKEHINESQYIVSRPGLGLIRLSGLIGDRGVTKPTWLQQKNPLSRHRIVRTTDFARQIVKEPKKDLLR